MECAHRIKKVSVFLLSSFATLSADSVSLVYLSQGWWRNDEEIEWRKKNHSNFVQFQLEYISRGIYANPCHRKYGWFWSAFKRRQQRLELWLMTLTHSCSLNFPERLKTFIQTQTFCIWMYLHMVSNPTGFNKCSYPFPENAFNMLLISFCVLFRKPLIVERDSRIFLSLGTEFERSISFAFWICSLFTAAINLQL